MSKSTDRRHTKLILPRLQLKLIGGFLGVCALSLLIQFTLFSYRTSEWAAGQPGAERLAVVLPGLLLSVLAVSFGVLLPAILCVGIASTFRIAGPLYRFQEHLKGIVAGGEIEPCRLRKDDELQELCGLLNAALTEAQKRGAGISGEELEQAAEREAA